MKMNASLPVTQMMGRQPTTLLRQIAAVHKSTTTMHPVMSLPSHPTLLSHGVRSMGMYLWVLQIILNIIQLLFDYNVPTHEI